LATIVVMNIAFVGVLAGTGTAIRLSGQHRGMANTQVALAVAAEAVKAKTPSPACATDMSASYTVALAGIASQLPAGWTTASNLSITATCDNATTLKLQTVTLVATAPTSGACPAAAPCTDSIVVLKRSP
jgi:hypothetical protein